MNRYKKISKCRICGNQNLVLVVDLGVQYLTGVFPRYVAEDEITCGPLRLVKCNGDNFCGLLQLEHSYDLSEMYGQNYGYRSGLNAGMVRHLHNKVDRILGMVQLEAGDFVLDIGSNDGTTLGAYPSDLLLVGMDPTGEKFQKYYSPHIKLIPDFFSAQKIAVAYPSKKAKVVTSFSMFYDLEDPVGFAREVANTLHQDGIWVFEQSYMPLMLERNAYDTICHEHLEYYGLRQIVWLAELAGLKIIDVELNDVNGGSFSVVAVLRSSLREDERGVVAQILASENAQGLSDLMPYQAFARRTEDSRRSLKDFVANARSEGKLIRGLGASTKGNVILQYCEFDESDIATIGEINTDKFGALTPGSWIPIESEVESLKSMPDYLLVLPWHFRDSFLNNPLYAGQNLVFPLPKLNIVKT